jgi:hypothetical protein
LERENVADRSVIAIGPDVRTSLSFDQLGHDSHTVGGFANAALQNVANAKLAASRRYVVRPRLESEG